MLDWGRLYPLGLLLVRVAGILAGAFAATLIINWLIRGVSESVMRAVRRDDDPGHAEIEKQTATIAGILRKTAAVVVYAFAAVAVLRELGYDVGPLLAGAGVVGLAIGFGAQNLVRDVISGFFLLVENQIRVNDAVVINDTPGTVEEINLRTTVLRDIEGTVHVFPNGLITKLANKTQDHSYYVFNLPLAWSDDADRAMAILRSVCEEVAAEDSFRALILAPVEVFGVDHLGDSHINIKARLKTLPGKQWDAGREVNRRLRTRLLEAGMTVPVRSTRTIETVNASPELLRRMIREELDDAAKTKPR